MALSKMSWDELNILVGYDVSEPYDEYYAPMHITKRQKERRIALAEDLEIVFAGLLEEIFYCEQLGVSIPDDIYQRAVEEYMSVIGSVVTTDEYLIDHATSTVADTIAVLRRHREDPFYYSKDRAMAISEDEANSVWNHSEYKDARKKYKNKTWDTIMDGKERDSHAELNGVTLPIDEPFLARGGYLLYPRDDSMGASPEELHRCRCSLSFS